MRQYAARASTFIIRINIPQLIFDIPKIRSVPHIHTTCRNACLARATRSYPKEGAYCEGLFLDGARWNRQEGCLEEPPPMELFYQMPVIHFKVIIPWCACPLFSGFVRAQRNK